MLSKCRDKSKSWKGYGEISGKYFSSIKGKAKDRGITFKVSIQYIWAIFQKQEGRCALSGVKLKFPKTSRSRGDSTASLDRIDSKKGYIKGNIQFLHKTVNIMKWHYPEKEFVKFCKKIAAYNK